MDKFIVVWVILVVVCIVGSIFSFNEIYQKDKARTELCISYGYMGCEYSDELNEYVCYKYVKDPSVDVGYLKIRSGILPNEMIFQEDD